MGLFLPKKKTENSVLISDSPEESFRCVEKEKKK
jgi:hypothetical protein